MSKRNGVRRVWFASEAGNTQEQAYWEGFLPGGPHDGGPDDGNIHVRAFLLHHDLSQGLGVGVGVGPVPNQLGSDLINDCIIQPPEGRENEL